MKQLPEGQTLLSQRQPLLSQKRKSSQSDMAGALGHHMPLTMPKLCPPKPPISGLFPFGQVPNFKVEQCWIWVTDLGCFSSCLALRKLVFQGDTQYVWHPGGLQMPNSNFNFAKSTLVLKVSPTYWYAKLQKGARSAGV